MLRIVYVELLVQKIWFDRNNNVKDLNTFQSEHIKAYF